MGKISTILKNQYQNQEEVSWVIPRNSTSGPASFAEVEPVIAKTIRIRKI